MATTYSLNSDSYQGRYLRLSCTQTKNVTTNKSTINWTLTSTGGTSNYYSTGPTTVKIAGKTVYSKARVLWDAQSFPASKGSVSGSLVVDHTTTGTKSVAVSLSTAIYTTTVTTKSGTWTLDTIPRYFTKTPTLTTGEKTETSINFDWATSETCSKVIFYYKKSGESTYTSSTVYDDSTGTKSGTFEITDLESGTFYTCYITATRKDSGLTSNSITSDYDTQPYPYIQRIDKPNFIIGDTITVDIYNPLNREFTFYIKKDTTSGMVFYSETTSDTQLTITPSSNLLYQSIPNEDTGNVVFYCVYESNVGDITNGTYHVNESESTPIFTNFTYADTNSVITGVTGDNQVLVKNLSTLRATISSSNKMVTRNYATPSKYTATFDTKSQSANYSTSNVNIDMGTVNSTGSKRLSITAYDSRGLTTVVYKDIQVYDYINPTINSTLARLNNFENQTTLKISGTYDKLTINGINKNAVTSVQYRYRETNGTWGNWVTVSVTMNNGNFTCSDVILNLDNTKSFEFELKVEDRLSSGTNTNSVAEGVPIFFVSSNKKTCYIGNDELGKRVDIPALKNYIELSSYVDLNTVLEFGTYRCVSDSQSISNKPSGITGGFTMFVSAWAGDNSTTTYRKQVISYNDETYIRRTQNGGTTWSNWVKLLSTENIKTTKTISDTDTYSCNYIDGVVGGINLCKTITFNNTWQYCQKAGGSTYATVLYPIYNPENKIPHVNITSAEIYSGGWKPITNVHVLSGGYSTTFVILNLPTSVTLTSGYCYLFRMVGSVTTDY